MILRDYQDAGIEAVRKTYQLGHRAVLYVLPTGGGKTVTFNTMASRLVASGWLTYIIVHRIELLDQTSAGLTAMGIEHGLIAAGRTPLRRAMLQVGTIQTIMRRLAELPVPKFIILDEAHHSAAGTWAKLLQAWNGTVLFGCTATPERLDGRGLNPPFTSMVLGPTVKELIGRGFLSPPVVYAPKVDVDLSGVGTAMGDFKRDEIEKIMSGSVIVGNAVEHYRKLCDKVPAIAFCVSVAHAQRTADAFKNAGYRAAMIEGRTDKDERRDAIKALGDGRLDVLTSCELISEGVDVPVVGAGIMLRPTQSLGLWLQQCGRVLRPAAGKTRAVILDHAGNSRRPWLGLPDWERPWALDGMKRRSRKDADKGPVLKQCGECFAMCLGGQAACPHCGAPFEIKARTVGVLDGQLQEVKGGGDGNGLPRTTDPELIAIQKMTHAQRLRWADNIEKLKQVAVACGYSQQWAYKQVHVRVEMAKKYGHKARV